MHNINSHQKKKQTSVCRAFEQQCSSQMVTAGEMEKNLERHQNRNYLEDFDFRSLGEKHLKGEQLKMLLNALLPVSSVLLKSPQHC